VSEKKGVDTKIWGRGKGGKGFCEEDGETRFFSPKRGTGTGEKVVIDQILHVLM
jgi:hypothetical protein